MPKGRQYRDALPLTPKVIEAYQSMNCRERELVERLMNGYCLGEIAPELGIAKRTVKADMGRLFVKFGITRGIKRVKLAVLVYRCRAAFPAVEVETKAPQQAALAQEHTVYGGA
jgi:DNA-binding NarL/FixJ family response regulator